jgi:hypothetical protein
MSDSDPEKLSAFREAHELRRLALASKSPTRLEIAAKLYDKLGCSVNAEKIRFVVTHPRYLNNYSIGSTSDG